VWWWKVKENAACQHFGRICFTLSFTAHHIFLPKHQEFYVIRIRALSRISIFATRSRRVSLTVTHFGSQYTTSVFHNTPFHFYFTHLGSLRTTQVFSLIKPLMEYCWFT